MSARAAGRRPDLVAAYGMAASVYNGCRLLGFVHRVSRGYLAENTDGERLGLYATAERAAHEVVLTAGRTQ
jgi:hypothetical protein